MVDPQEAVDQLFGAGRARVVDADTRTTVTEREVVLVNGVAVQLVGEDGDQLRAALLSGKLPDHALVSRLLASVLGADLRGLTKLETDLTVTSQVTTRDTLTVHRAGRLLDQRSSETRLDTRLEGHCRDTVPPPRTSSPSPAAAAPVHPSQAPPSAPPSSTSTFTSSSSPSSLSSSPSPRPPSRVSHSPPRTPPSTPPRSTPTFSPDLVEALSRTSLHDPRAPAAAPPPARPRNGEYVRLHHVHQVSTQRAPLP